MKILQLISDAGYQGEITTVSTACHQIEVFSRVLRTSVKSFLEGGEDAIKKNLPEFTVGETSFMGRKIFFGFEIILFPLIHGV